MICGFILPRYMLLYYGSATNGLVASITNFLSFISLLDMGVGSVIQANLYKPLSDGDDERISLIVKSSDRFFRRIASIFIAYIAILCILFPTVIRNDYSPLFSITLLVIISISTFVQYFFGMTFQLLLNADQKAYIPLSLSIITIIFNTVLSVVMMKAGASIHTVKLMTASVYLLRPIGQYIYVKKHYNINRNIQLKGEPIKQKWNGFSQHLAAVVSQNIDIVTLTFFSTLENVSIYSVYFTVTNGVEQIIMTAATGIESLFGNMIARGEEEKLYRTFEQVEWIVHFLVTVVFTIAAITIVPFVSVYTREINDANYIVPLFGFLIVTAYGFQCLRIPYFRIIKAAGHFKETQNGSFIAAALNIFITVSLVFKYGLIGAATGTLVAMLYHTLYFVWYLRKHIINRGIVKFAKLFFADLLVAIISFFCSQIVDNKVINYLDWIRYALLVSCIVFAVSCFVNCVFFTKNIIALLRLKKSISEKQDS